MNHCTRSSAQGWKEGKTLADPAGDPESHLQAADQVLGGRAQRDVNLHAVLDDARHLLRALAAHAAGAKHCRANQAPDSDIRRRVTETPRNVNQHCTSRMAASTCNDTFLKQDLDASNTANHHSSACPGLALCALGSGMD